MDGNLNTTSAYVTDMGNEERQNRISNILYLIKKYCMSLKKSRGRRKMLGSGLLIFRMLFGGIQPSSSDSINFQNGVNYKTKISRVLEEKSFTHQEHDTQAYRAVKISQTVFKIPYGGDSSRPNKFTAGSKARSNAKRDFEKRQTGKKKTTKPSAGSPFVQSFTIEPNFSSRPNRNRLFRKFTPNERNPGCARGPRTILLSKRGADKSTKLTTYDGFEAELTDKSENHLTSKHGHNFGVDDPLPLNSNQRATKYKQDPIRTRLNNENKAKCREGIKSSLSNPKSIIYPNVNVRGIKGRVYYDETIKCVIVIHTEGEFTGQIKKAQPITEEQLENLRKLNILS